MASLNSTLPPVIYVGIFLILSAILLQVTRSAQAVKRRTATASGVVVGHRIETDSESSDRTFTIARFTTADCRTVNAESSLPNSHVGQNVTVHYEPKQPSNAHFTRV